LQLLSLSYRKFKSSFVTFKPLGTKKIHWRIAWSLQTFLP
jgi:hypothetical protein